ncbi:hypothetical protein A3765_05190 [Oleiphilus sp. HI0130]|nr:hypothetical protein A3744_24130 [Oleiphilus sp. HI0073]KZZ14347.1 hypothetical protein A3750_02225 [Oleiphilus sp. HI0079]KZZ40652.1 hypothetical protein A3758_07975 [Oleiphilus sp. HI0118]KZZ51783.1 hypothetical protein A3760_11645 [Oleiphilus sp. HI0122]KZZ66513.1 hypothetical protein A3765_05190 [Oleiphilus sp. HI0130]
MRILFLLLIFIFYSVSVHSSEGETKRSDSNASDFKSVDAPQFSVITTGYSAGTLEAMVVEGGDVFEVRTLAHPAVLVRHPKGVLLWDTGLGTQLEDQMASFSWFDQQLFKVVDHKPAVEQLREAGFDLSLIDMVIPSHMHWDHVSGLEDFSPVPVWVQEVSFKEAQEGEPPGFVASQFDDPSINWSFISLEDGAYEGFAQSMDVFGDSSVVLVDTSGHAHGHLGMFLNLEGGARYFFIGDTTWVLEGVTNNSSRPWLVKTIVGVDADFEQNAGVVEKVHQLSVDQPDIVIVPAHDERVLESLPAFPVFFPSG